MQFQTGHAKLGGKKKGKSKKSEVEAIAKRIGVEPFAVLCLLAKGDWKALEVKEGSITLNQRLDAAKEASKYLYAQKRAVEIANPEGQGFKLIIEDYVGNE